MYDMMLLKKFVPRHQLSWLCFRTIDTVEGPYFEDLLEKATARIRNVPNLTEDAKLRHDRAVKLHYTIEPQKQYWYAKPPCPLVDKTEYFFSEVEPVNMIGYGLSMVNRDKNSIKIGFTHFINFLSLGLSFTKRDEDVKLDLEWEDIPLGDFINIARSLSQCSQ